MRTYISQPFDRNNFEQAYNLAEGYKSMKSSEDEQWVSAFDIVPCVDAPLPYMVSRRIEALLQCDTVYMLKGWNTDKICILEREAAVRFGKTIKYEELHENLS